MSEFQGMQKIARFYRDIVISEKIDGTSGLISIGAMDVAPEDSGTLDSTVLYAQDHECKWDGGEVSIGSLVVRAGSRNRWLTRKTDNFGFAKWVQENAEELIKLGPGNHFGEWWGSGIQRGYGLTDGDKRFSLFATHRWRLMENCAGVWETDKLTTGVVTIEAPGLLVVPVLYRGPLRHNMVDFSPATDAIQEALRRLKAGGSNAVRGFMNPEGIVIYHEASKQLFKVTLDHNDEHKG